MMDVDKKQVNEVAAMLHQMGVKVCLYRGDTFTDTKGAEVLTGRTRATIYRYMKTVAGFPQKKNVQGQMLFSLSDFPAFQNAQEEAA